MTRLLLVAALFLPACVAYQKGGLFPGDGDTVYVVYFANDTFYRGLELSLTEEVVDEIFSRPGLDLTSREEAEILLTGRIVDVRQRVLSEDPTQTVTSANSTITVIVEVRDARTGNVIKTRRISQRSEFVPDLGETLSDAQSDIFDLLARDIVRVLETDF